MLQNGVDSTMKTIKNHLEIKDDKSTRQGIWVTDYCVYLATYINDGRSVATRMEKKTFEKLIEFYQKVNKK